MVYYKYLDTSDGANSTETVDANDVTIYTIDLTEAGNSEAVGIEGIGKRTYQITTSSVGGSGTLTLQYSIDGINWDTEVDDSGTDVTWTISSDTTFKYSDSVLSGRYHRFNIDGSNSSGTITIRVV